MKQIEQSGSVMDKVRYVVAVGVLLASLVAYYFFSELPLAARVAVMLVGVAIAAGLVWTTTKGLSVRKHLHDTRREVAQVVWPSREQTIRMTLIVFGAVVVVGGFLWLIDMFFLWGVQVLTGRGE